MRKEEKKTEGGKGNRNRKEKSKERDEERNSGKQGPPKPLFSLFDFDASFFLVVARAREPQGASSARQGTESEVRDSIFQKGCEFRKNRTGKKNI